MVMENEQSKKAKKPILSLSEIDYIISYHKHDTYFVTYKWDIDNLTGETLLYIIEVLYGYPKISIVAKSYNSLNLIHYLADVIIEAYSNTGNGYEKDDDGYFYNFQFN